MITIKNKQAILKMEKAGSLLSEIFADLSSILKSGVTTLDLDTWIADQMRLKGLASQCKGYMGYKHVSCISVNDEVVHGVPSKATVLADGDLVKVDICTSWKGYCADAARCYFVGGTGAEKTDHLVKVAKESLDAGIEKAVAGNRLSDISAAIQSVVEKNGYGVVRDFAGHGIGKRMHEEPEILNYGQPGKGPVLRAGMTLAIEPMITMGAYHVYVTHDGWTVKTKDKSLAAHVEDTVLITNDKPRILTRVHS